MSDDITVTLTRREAAALAASAQMTLDMVDPRLTSEVDAATANKAAGLAAVRKIRTQLQEV